MVREAQSGRFCCPHYGTPSTIVSQHCKSRSDLLWLSGLSPDLEKAVKTRSEPHYCISGFFFDTLGLTGSSSDEAPSEAAPAVPAMTATVAP